MSSSNYVSKIVTKGVMFGYVRQQVVEQGEAVWSAWSIFF